MIDARVRLRGFARFSPRGQAGAPLLRWEEDWGQAAGRNVVSALLDTGINEEVPDLAGADLVIRDFTGASTCPDSAAEHGTHSATLLVGQGRHKIRGLVPRSRLLCARVVGQNSVASPDSVAAAMDWVLGSGAQVIVIPLGEATEREEIAHRIDSASRISVIFAAAGNCFPEPVYFPARHSHVIAVGAATDRGCLLPECSRLPCLDLIAPGHRIPAIIRGRVVRRRSGTSVACVLAAGAAVLALSAGFRLSNYSNTESFLRIIGR